MTNRTYATPLVSGAFALLLTACDDGSNKAIATDAGPGVDRMISADDRDGDGLSNEDEIAGWDISVDRMGLGETVTAHVTSDPDDYDSDDDGLEDGDEYQKTDPTEADTDGDGLTDGDEVRVYLSIATSVDSDGDSISGGTSNTQLWDGDEVSRWGTSPSLNDTDGDAKTDFEEIISNATNPLVAQVPMVELSFAGEMDVRLTVDYSDTGGSSMEFGDTYSLATTTEESRSDSFSSTLSAEASVTVGVEASAGFPESSVTASASATVSAGYSQENATSLTNTASQTAQQDYQRVLSESFEHTESSASGEMSIGMTLRNPSTIAYTLTNLSVTAFQWDSEERTFRTLATLTPVLDSFTLAPNEERAVPQQVQATGVNADLIRSFMRQPSSLYFRVSNFDMENSEGLNFAFLDETTSARTGLIVIDYGNGTVEQFRVATNVRRNPDGTPAGASMKTIFEDYLDIPYETTEWQAEDEPGDFADKVGVKVLSGIRDVRTATPESGERRFWAIYSNVERHGDRSVDFDDIVLSRGESIHLAYCTDLDRDGLFSREEFLHGSSDTLEDTDSDGLTDPEEVREGWTAGEGLSGATGYPREVFSDPTEEDVDSDGSTDEQEKAAGTDPNNDDTDRDGLLDGMDSSPLSSGNDAPTISLSLMVSDPTATLTGSVIDSVDSISSVVIDWGDATSTTISSGFGAINAMHAYLASDMYTITATATDARGARSEMSYSATIAFPSAGLVAHYNLNSLDGMRFDDSSGGSHDLDLYDYSSSDGFVTGRTVASSNGYNFQNDRDTPDYSYAVSSIGVSLASGDFSVAYWMQRKGDGGEDGALVSQGGGFKTGVLSGRPRIVFGDTEETVTDEASIPSNTWTFLVFTRSGTTAKIYVNGTEVKSQTIGAYTADACANLFLNGTEYGSGCGGAPDDDYTSHYLDDVRVYSRALGPSEVTLLYTENGFGS